MNRQHGYSLVELLIALSIGLITIGGVSLVLISSAGIYRVSDGRARVAENARFSLGALQDDLRMAGYMGCFNYEMFPSRFTNLAKDPDAFENAVATQIGGYEAAGAGWNPALPAVIGSGGHAPIAGNDVLVLRGPVGNSLPLSDTMPTTSAPIPLASVDGLSVGGLAIVSDCSHANVFAVTQLPADKMVVHAANLNSDAKLTKVFSVDNGATVTPIATISYFIAASSDGVAGRRSLWRQENANPAEEIADGVDRLQLEYGVDTSSPRDQVANTFVTADAIGDGTVVAVRLALLLRSQEDRLVRRTQVYNYDGVPDITAPDLRIYTPYTTTIALRNRLN